MCGLSGIVKKSSSENLKQSMQRMHAALKHRGPNAEGVWYDEAQGVALAHRRLSILDLTEAGAQPMHSPDGRYAIVFNGEVYNFAELKTDLEKQGASFRGGSDTEVILAAFQQWGIEKSLQKFIGMFALALWDREKRELTLARDRFGVKPLYYGWQNAAFLFASELSAIAAAPECEKVLDQVALLDFFTQSCIAAPASAYRGVYKLVAGTWLTLSMDQLTQKPQSFSAYAKETQEAEGVAIQPVRFWDAFAEVERSLGEVYAYSDQEAIAQADSLLSDAVRLRMIADVPVGAFLSGGIDSSLTVALMQRHTQQKIKTYGIGFDIPGFDESAYARQVAKHLGTDHHEIRLTAQDVVSRVPEILGAYSEPFADSSMLPTYLVSEFAHSQVTVALSGDGGDELCNGYPRHVWAPRVWAALTAMPECFRKKLSRILSAVPESSFDMLFKGASGFFPQSLSFKRYGEKFKKVLEASTEASIRPFYGRLMSPWQEAKTALTTAALAEIAQLGGAQFWYNRGSIPRVIAGRFRQLSYMDVIHYLPDQVLVKVDRATMAHGLEAREPLLDHRLFQFMWRLPDTFKYRGGQTKWLLKQVLAKYVPKELFDRPKAGFTVPVAEWLRGGLRDWAESELSIQKLQQQNILDAQAVRKIWQEHLSGVRNWEHAIWSILSFQVWYQKYHNKA